MDPMKIITYVAVTAVLALVALGGVAFYAGYTAGLGGPDKPAAADTSGASSETLAEIKSLNRELASLKQELAAREDNSEARADALAESRAKLAAMSDELETVKSELAEAREENESLRARLSAGVTPAETSDQAGERRTASATAAATDDSVLLYDRFQMERASGRDFEEVDLRFGLQTVGSRSAGLSVNDKRISMQVRDGKQIIHKGVTCELILLETDRQEQRAQFSLACKR